MTTSLVFRRNTVAFMEEQIKEHAATLEKIVIYNTNGCIDRVVRLIEYCCENLRIFKCSLYHITPSTHVHLERIADKLSTMVLTHAEPEHVQFYRPGKMRKFVLMYASPYGGQARLLRFAPIRGVPSLFVDISENWSRSIDHALHLMRYFGVDEMRFYHDMDVSFVEPTGYLIQPTRSDSQFVIRKRTAADTTLPLVYFGPFGDRPVVTQPVRVLMDQLSDFTAECLSGIEAHVKEFNVIERNVAADIDPRAWAAVERCGLVVPVKA